MVHNCSQAPSKVRIAFLKAEVVISVSRGWRVVECIEGIPWPDLSYIVIASFVAEVIKPRSPSRSALAWSPDV